MHIAIRADELQREELFSKAIPAHISVTWNEPVVADAYFDLLFEEESTAFFTHANTAGKVVFVHAVTTKREALPANVVRLNAWNGFLKRDIIEVAAMSDIQKVAEKVLEELGWKYAWAPDEPGMIAGRILAMIINEAYFTFGDGVSTREEIDIAMKLGTNYPYGPFEWSRKIGLDKIYALLVVLGETSSRYAIAPALQDDVLIKV